MCQGLCTSFRFAPLILTTTLKDRNCFIKVEFDTSKNWVHHLPVCPHIHCSPYDTPCHKWVPLTPLPQTHLPAGNISQASLSLNFVWVWPMGATGSRLGDRRKQGTLSLGSFWAPSPLLWTPDQGW